MRMRMISWFGPATGYSTDTCLSNRVVIAVAPRTPPHPTHHDFFAVQKPAPQTEASPTEPTHRRKNFTGSISTTPSSVPTRPLQGALSPGAGGNDAAPPDDSWLEVQAATAFGSLWRPRASLWDRRGKCMDGGGRCQHAPFIEPRKSVFRLKSSDSEGSFPEALTVLAAPFPCPLGRPRVVRGGFVFSFP